MKKVFFTILTLAGFAVTALAQNNKPLQAVIKTPNASCEACKSRIETYLDRYDGVLEVNVNYRKGETKVKWLADRTDFEQIKAAIANAGYDADDVVAEEGAYKRLPLSCKKFEDGGGHPKPKVVPVVPKTPNQ